MRLLIAQFLFLLELLVLVSGNVNSFKRVFIWKVIKRERIMVTLVLMVLVKVLVSNSRDNGAVDSVCF